MKLKGTKKQKSSVKGDIHLKLMQALNVEFSKPVSIIFNSILKKIQTNVRNSIKPFCRSRKNQK